MIRFVVYDREAKKFLTSKEYKERGDLCLANIDMMNTDDGFTMTFNLPRYLVIVGSDFLPRGAFIEDWIVFTVEYNHLPPINVRKLSYAYNADEVRARRCSALNESRNDYFNASKCAPSCLEGIRASSKNFICNVALLRKIAPELF